MAYLDQLGLPDGSTYNFKDNTQERSDHRHYESDRVPLIHKLYESTSYYATTNDYANASWYFMSVVPDAWYKPWRVDFKVHTYCPSYASYESYTWSTICGRETGYSYANWNEKYSTAHSYITFYPLKKAGFDAGYGHAIGISIYNADNRTSSAYYRTFEIDYFYCENCTVTILDTPVLWENWTGKGTTNYGSIAAIDAINRGLRETGDDNTVTENRINYFAGKTGSKGVWANGLFMEDANGTYQNICTGSDGTVTSTSRTTDTTKIANTNGFKVGSSIWYTNTTYNANTNISGSGVIWSSTSIFDTRYSFNTTLTANFLTPYIPLYLVGTIDPSDDLFYLDSVWWTQTPNDTSKIYVLVGGVYDSTTSNCRATLYEQNKWFRYDGTQLIEIANDARTLQGHSITTSVTSGNSDLVTSGAVYTSLSNKMDKTNPTGTGSFSLNRKAGTTVGLYSFAEGSMTEASGMYSHAEGNMATASGMYSHAEGNMSQASGSSSHAEGYSSITSKDNAHAEGYGTRASGLQAHAEGQSTTASGTNSHAEGYSTSASGQGSHAEGNDTNAVGAYSHVEGLGTAAYGHSQHVFGEYNTPDATDAYVEIVGNGTSKSTRSNARTLDWNGNETLAGSVTATGGFIGNLTGDASTVNSHTVNADVPSGAVFTDTTYTFADGTNSFTVTPSGGSAQTVNVTPSIADNITGSGTSGYLTKFNGTNTITNGPQLGSSTTTYLNNAGSWATPPDTKNTAGSTDTASKIYLIGATSQAANPQTYSDNEVYATSGVLTTKTVQIGGGSCSLVYNSTTKSCDFIFS